VTLAEVLRRSADYLAAKGVDSPRVDAEHLLSHALGLTRIALYTQHDRPLTPGELDTIRSLVRRRGEREPLAYVLGEWGFRRLTLRTDARALVPRPETEVVVERCLALLAGLDAPRVLDVGVGSGAIALALVDEHPGARVTAVDVSPEALSLARENAARLGLDVELRAGGVEAAAEGWDLIVSNPPYVGADELPGLQPEVRDWEPRGALVDEGLHAELVRTARTTWLVLEVAAGRAPAVARELEEAGYRGVRITRDLSGHERVVEGRRA
jgi:release factor glutamine methyltransferase